MKDQYQVAPVLPQRESPLWRCPDNSDRRSGLSGLARKLLLSLYLYSGFVAVRDAILALSGRSRVVVLCYHRIGTTDVLTTSPEDFQQDLFWLKRHYECISLAELCARIRTGKPFRRRAAVITFDDGYRDNFTAAMPALQAAEMTATFFVSTGYISTEREFPHDTRMLALNNQPGRFYPKLTWDDLRYMEKQGFEIGSHTVSHLNLGEADETAIRQEISESLARLNQELGTRPRAFAYPWGKPANIPACGTKLLRQAGYYAAASAYGGTNHPQADLYNIRRIDAGNGELGNLSWRARIAGFDPDGLKLRLGND